jgi:GTP-binding protein
MEIKKSDFLCSNSDWKKCPKPNLPEYAFIGRSNVGKSSLINALTNSKKTSKNIWKAWENTINQPFLDK